MRHSLHSPNRFPSPSLAPLENLAGFLFVPESKFYLSVVDLSRSSADSCVVRRQHLNSTIHGLSYVRDNLVALGHTNSTEIWDVSREISFGDFDPRKYGKRQRQRTRGATPPMSNRFDQFCVPGEFLRRFGLFAAGCLNGDVMLLRVPGGLGMETGAADAEPGESFGRGVSIRSCFDATEVGAQQQQPVQWWHRGRPAIRTLTYAEESSIGPNVIITSSTSDNSVALWDIETLSLTGRLRKPHHQVTGVQVAEDRNMICTVHNDYRGEIVRYWDAKTLDECLPCLANVRLTNARMSIWSHSRNLLVVASEKEVAVVDLRLPSLPYARFHAHFKSILGMCEIDRDRFATSSLDETCAIWSYEGRKQRKITLRGECGNVSYVSPLEGLVDHLKAEEEARISFLWENDDIERIVFQCEIQFAHLKRIQVAAVFVKWTE